MANAWIININLAEMAKSNLNHNLISTFANIQLSYTVI